MFILKGNYCTKSEKALSSYNKLRQIQIKKIIGKILSQKNEMKKLSHDNLEKFEKYKRPGVSKFDKNSKIS